MISTCLAHGLNESFIKGSVIYPRASQAVKILTSGPDKISIPFFKSAEDLKDSKPSIAHLILSEFTASDATSQSSCRCPDRKITNYVLHTWLAPRKMGNLE
jgi:hypothetical protein